MTEEIRQKFECLQEAQIKYNIVYGEAAYCLGYSDGEKVGMEKGADGNHTILTVRDMSYLITMYEAIRKMNKTLLGKFELHTKDEGVLGALECVMDVIDSGMAEQYKLLGEAEAAKIGSVLNDDTLLPGEKAKILLGHA